MSISKKNTWLRIASFMLVLTLISTVAVGGTFAKYVTEGSGSDNARVAKWGIMIQTEGDGVFAEEYDGTVETSVEGEKLVAPGTKGTEFKATVSGKPEVDAMFKLALSDCKEVLLPAGTYTDYTHLGEDGKYSDTFTLDEDYMPVILHLTINLGGREIALQGHLTEIEAQLNSIGNGDGLEATLEANQEIPEGSSVALSWEWPFEQNDAADTLLGNVAAGKVEAPAGCVTEIAYNFVASATQID